MKEKSDEINKNKTGFKNAASLNKQAEKSFNKSDEKYRTILENMQEGYFEVDLAGKFTFCNDAICRLIGYSKDALMGMSNRQYTDEEELKKVFRAYNKVYKTGEPNNGFGWQIIRKDGAKRYIEGSISLLKDSSGNPTGFRGIVTDITERKQAEESLHQSMEKYRTILETIQESYFEVDLAGNFTFFNDSLCQLSGCSREELLGMNNLQFIDKETAKEVFHVFNKVYNTGEPSKGFDWQMTRKDGAKKYVEASASLLKNSTGKPIGFRGIIRDITERKRAEESLRQSEGKYRTILERIEDGYYEVDLVGNFTFFNDSMCRITGCTREELVGINYGKFLDKDNPKNLFQVFNKVYKTGDPIERFDWMIIRKDGTKRHIEASVSLIKEPSGKSTGFRGIIRDVTERNKIEEQYRLLADNITEHIWLRDINTLKVIYISPSVEKMYGYPVDEIRKFPLKKLLTEESFQKMIDSFITEMPKALKTLPPVVHKYSFETQAHHKDGHLLWMDNTLSFIRDENGILAFLLGETRDITERKQAEEKLQQTLESLKRAVGTTIQVLVSALETRDPYTAGHQSRSADLARAIATEMGLSPDKIEGIHMASIIHDIGKLAVPAEILTKPTKLTNIEFSLIKEHSRSGYEMLKDVESPWPLAQIVHQHHERMDGSGYPRKLKGDEILLEARILAVADVVEAMASHRPYRPSLGIEVALEEIEKNKGVYYDDDVADVCLRLFREKGFHLT